MKILFEIDLPDEVVAELKQIILTKLLSDTEIGENIVRQFITTITAPTPLPSKSELTSIPRGGFGWYHNVMGLPTRTAFALLRADIYPRLLLELLLGTEPWKIKNVGKIGIGQIREGFKRLGYNLEG